MKAGQIEISIVNSLTKKECKDLACSFCGEDCKNGAFHIYFVKGKHTGHIYICEGCFEEHWEE